MEMFPASAVTQYHLMADVFVRNSSVNILYFKITLPENFHTCLMRDDKWRESIADSVVLYSFCRFLTYCTSSSARF